MAENIGIRPNARLDVVEVAATIGNDNITAANHFLDACEATFDFLAKSPELGGVYPTKNPRLSGLRVFQVQGFPNHLTFYLNRPNNIEIVRIVHGARDIDAILRDE